MTPRNPTVAWTFGLMIGGIVAHHPDMSAAQSAFTILVVSILESIVQYVVHALTPPAERAKAASWRWFRAWALRRLG